MQSVRRYGIAVLLSAALALPATAGAARLPLSVARDRADAFAKQTCKRDDSCVRSGVTNCHRRRARVVLCRIYLRRDTDVQGGYRCTRLVRLSAIRGARHARVSGVGDWHC